MSKIASSESYKYTQILSAMSHLAEKLRQAEALTLNNMQPPQYELEVMDQLKDEIDDLYSELIYEEAAGE